MTEIMPFPKNNIILFYWTAPTGRVFLLLGIQIVICRVVLHSCHSERAQRVEGSWHRFCCKRRRNAKILRLCASHSAQNDMLGGAVQQLAKLKFDNLRTLRYTVYI